MLIQFEVQSIFLQPVGFSLVDKVGLMVHTFVN